MYMTQSEIVDRYVRRGTSITILAELNATRVDQIREILTDAGVELPEASTYALWALSLTRRKHTYIA